VYDSGIQVLPQATSPDSQVTSARAKSLVNGMPARLTLAEASESSVALARVIAKRIVSVVSEALRLKMRDGLARYCFLARVVKSRNRIDQELFVGGAGNDVRFVIRGWNVESGLTKFKFVDGWYV
jgi:hypothetical protein